MGTGIFFYHEIKKKARRAGMGHRGATQTLFQATLILIWHFVFYRIEKYSKLFTHGPSTCRGITQKSLKIVISPTRPG